MRLHGVSTGFIAQAPLLLKCAIQPTTHLTNAVVFKGCTGGILALRKHISYIMKLLNTTFIVFNSIFYFRPHLGA
jgi:hypothetical protein